MATKFLRRSLLYIPGSSQKMLDKSRSFSRADSLIFDLEDSVSLADKPLARQLVRSHLKSLPSNPASRQERILRVNARHTGLTIEDLAVLADAEVDAIMLPKVCSAADVRWLCEHVGRGVSVIALVESAGAVVGLREIAGAHAQLSGLVFAAEDYCADAGVTRTPSLIELMYARQAVVTHARAAGLDAIDLVCTALGGGGGEVLEREAHEGAGFGYTGKQCIHPNQVETVNKAFSPAQDRLDWAHRLLQHAQTETRGAFEFEGKMIDAPVLLQARSLVARFERGA
ncbi:hypothetical protein PYCC9005_002295 [Savitreella phatthalungensis]